MSLNRIAARICAVMALREAQTLVGNNVLDSQINALDFDAQGNPVTPQAKPFIAVYADSAVARGAELHTRATVPNGSTEFLFESGIATPHVETDKETGESVIYTGLPATDDAFEFHLDIVARQIFDALSDPGNEWAEIFRLFVSSYESIDRIRTSGDQKGVKLAATQIKIVVDLWADPIRGAALTDTHPLKRFYAKASTVPELAAKVSLMQAQQSADPRGWQLAVRRYGMTRPQADALLLTPHDGIEDADIDVVEVNTQPAVPVSGAPEGQQ